MKPHMKQCHASAGRSMPQSMRGLSLIELMISLVLGLLVVGGAIGVFLSNQQTYRATENLARVQENARIGFELMAREVREAAGNACANNLPVANVLNNAGATWWSNWANGVTGYENGALGGSAPATDAIDLLSATASGVTVVSHNGNSANFKVNTVDHGIEDGDVMMACDYSQASIFQVTGASSSNVTIIHNTGNSVAPGNCSKGLGIPMVCSATGTSKEYGANSQLVKMQATRWFVADNGRGGRSLYRMAVRKGVEQPREEVVEGIQDMQIQYLVDGGVAYTNASAGVDWTRVKAVSITLFLESAGRVGTDGETLKRQIAHIVTLRNRTS